MSNEHSEVANEVNAPANVTDQAGSEDWAESLSADGSDLVGTPLDQARGIREELKRQKAHEPTIKPAPGIFENFDSVENGNRIVRDINLVMGIPVELSVEIGRTKLSVKQILSLSQGSVVELDSVAGEPMTVFVNDCPIAKGEVVVVNDKFAIRLTDVMDPKEREKNIWS